MYMLYKITTKYPFSLSTIVFVQTLNISVLEYYITPIHITIVNILVHVILCSDVTEYTDIYK